MTKLTPPPRRAPHRTGRPPGKVINELLEHKLIREVSYEKYRDKVRDVYDGPKGAMLAACSMMSLHTPLGDRLFRERRFDLAGARHILDVGSGAGQLAKHVLKYADREAELTCSDLSHEMLLCARQRLKSDAAPLRCCRHDAAAVRRRLVRLRHVRLRVGAFARRPRRTRRAVSRDDARCEDAAVDHRGQVRRGVDQPDVVLPDVQPPRVCTGSARTWACGGKKNSGSPECTRSSAPAGSACISSRSRAARRGSRAVADFAPKAFRSPSPR